jgi:hypothetical protein
MDKTIFFVRENARSGELRSLKNGMDVSRQNK